MKRPPEAGLVVHFEASSKAARVMPWLLRRSLKPFITNVPLNRIGFTALRAVDLSGLAMRTPVGTTREAVRLDGFDAELVVAPSAAQATGMVVHLHGGGFAAGGLRSHRNLAARLSGSTGLPVLNVGYRYLPQAGLSTSLADSLEAYRWALDNVDDPGSVVLSGDSAGGYLACAVALRAVDSGLLSPAAIVALSPWLDLECGQSAVHPNAARDPFVSALQLARVGARLLGAEHPRPLEADLSALPPVLIQVGSTELLLGDAERLSRQLTAHGTPHELQIWNQQVHVFQIFAGILPEGRAAISQIGEFVRAHVQPEREVNSLRTSTARSPR